MNKQKRSILLIIQKQNRKKKIERVGICCRSETRMNKRTERKNMKMENKKKKALIVKV